MKIDVEKITPRQKLTIAKGLCDYQYIMDNWQKNDSDFQKIYYEFYLRARWPIMTESNNRKVYFQKLQDISPDDCLIDILKSLNLKNKSGKRSCEFSIGSKLLHTRNDLLPIYDRKVREYLSKEENVEFWWQIANKVSSAPRGIPEEEKIKHDWHKLCEWYEKFLISRRGIQWVKWFDGNFPTCKNISDVKKVDFIIFAAT